MIHTQKIPATATIGWLLIAGATGVLLAFTALSFQFEYPAILRQETSVILTRFHQGGNALIALWLCFALTGLPLIPAYILIGQQLPGRQGLLRLATTIGVTGLIVQLIGLLRWVFVVPVLANSFTTTTDAATQTAVIIAFKTLHQFAGVLLGEHLGQLFTIAWTVLLTIAFRQRGLFKTWVHVLAIVSSAIYLTAQAELFATVIPGFPVFKLAGFIGSTLWLLWLVIIGIGFVRMKPVPVE